MALIRNLTGLWLVALLTVQSANVGESLPHKLDIPFPLPFPTSENLDNLCCQGHGRPRYPDSYYPRSGFGYLRRRGKAINRLESWYTFCCSDQLAKENDFLVFCCAKQAWEKALSMFCNEEFSVMALPHLCCKSKGDDRWACFDSLPNPSYSPKPGYTAPSMSHEPGFTFNRHACFNGEKHKI